MSRKRKVRIPAVTVPATIYLVRWIDANHDDEYDGPSEGFVASLVEDSHVGYHVKTGTDHIVLAGSCIVDEDENHSRWHLTVPRVHITAMIRLEVPNAPEQRSD